MSKEEVTAGNKLIATFMNHGGGDNDEYNNKPLDYHQYWDFLMPVVEKIASCGKDYFTGITIEKGWTFCTIESPTKEFSDCNGASAIGTVWQAVTQFISWYNESLKTVK